MYGMDNAHALVIGIANYQSINKLPASVIKDAQSVYDSINESRALWVSPSNVQLLVDGEATQSAIRQALTGV